MLRPLGLQRIILICLKATFQGKQGRKLPRFLNGFVSRSALDFTTTTYPISSFALVCLRCPGPPNWFPHNLALGMSPWWNYPSDYLLKRTQNEFDRDFFFVEKIMFYCSFWVIRNVGDSSVQARSGPVEGTRYCHWCKADARRWRNAIRASRQVIWPDISLPATRRELCTRM